MFDLEKAIAAWRRSYEINQVFSPEDLEELERHLRDHTEVLVRNGVTPQQAFEQALAGIGDYGSNETEYRKVFWDKLGHRHKVIPELHWRIAMLRSYLVLAMRNLRRSPGYTAINVFGLAAGMACCLLIGLYIQDELSYDGFHENADRIFFLGDLDLNPGHPQATTAYPLGAMLQAHLPEIEQVVRTAGGGLVQVTRESTRLTTDRQVLLTDPAFLRFFSFPLVKGRREAALASPDGAVITEEFARAYFGDEDPIGKTLQVKYYTGPFTVTVLGVAKNPPPNSTIQFDLVAPLTLLPPEYQNEGAATVFMYQTYVLTSKDIHPDELQRKINDVARKHSTREIKEGHFVMPLTARYLSGLDQSTGFKGNPRYLYIFGTVALFVLLIAVINYVNLVTARASQRAREVGVRKTLGAHRTQLAAQFFSESLLLSMAAVVVAVVLSAAALPGFNLLFDKSLSLSREGTLAGLGAVILLVLVVSIAAGAYPALVLARFPPAQVLRGAGATTISGRSRVRQGLVVVQFAATVALIIGTVVIYRQLQYVQTKNLGFNGEQVVVVDLPNADSDEMQSSLKQRILTHPGIERASIAEGLPGQFQIRMGYPLKKAFPQANSELPDIKIAPAVVDYDFLETLEIRVIAGRGFSSAFPSDEHSAYLINETAASALGWTLEEAIGKTAVIGHDADAEGEIIGVVADFHLGSLREAIEPVSLQLSPDASWSSTNSLVARLSPEHIHDGLKHVEAQVAQLAPGVPFQYQFLDEMFDAMYRNEEQLGRIFTSFAVLAVLIACMGLFGLAAFSAQQRTKEVGIRKVLGASVSSIVALLSKEFLWLVAVSLVLAAPVAYFAMEKWLQDFAYHIVIGPGIFILAGLLALGIALATVSYQALRSALANPVESLRYE